jgi:hypothetical protein
VASNDSRAHNWRSIREWDGSQHRAFEELCFQLRTPAPPGWETMTGERQPVTAEHPRVWREFSQSAGRTAEGQCNPGTIVTEVKRSIR